MWGYQWCCSSLRIQGKLMGENTASNFKHVCLTLFSSLPLSPSPPPPTSLFSLFPLLSLPSSLFFLPLLFLFSFVCVVLMHDSWNVCMHVCIYVHVDLQQKHTCTHVCAVHVYTYAVHVAFSTYLYMCIRWVMVELFTFHHCILKTTVSSLAQLFILFIIIGIIIIVVYRVCNMTVECVWLNLNNCLRGILCVHSLSCSSLFSDFCL